MKRTIIILFILLLPTALFADEDGVKKYKNYTPEQIKELPNEVRSSTVPMMYTMAAQKGLSEGIELIFGMELNSLMYPGIHDYKEAIKAFQSDLGDKPTGVLTVWQIHSLGQRAEMQKLSRVLLPEQFSSFITEDYASIEGTMTLIDERIAYPINHVKVECYKNQNYCEFNQIYILVPKEDSWSQTYHVMESGTEYYDITRWGENSIDCVPRETGSGCRTTSMNFNFKTKEFFYMTRNAGGDCEFMGVKIPKLEKPRIGQIVDGSEIINKEFGAVTKAAFDVLASDFRAKIEKLISKESTTKE